MRVLLIVGMLGFLGSPALAKSSCPKKSQKEISCKNVEGHKRDFICYKGKLSKKRVAKLCKRVAKKQKTKSSEKS